MQSYWMRVGSKSNGWFPDKKSGHRETQMYRGGGHVTVEAEIKVM